MKKIFTCILVAAAAHGMAQKSGLPLTPNIEGPYSMSNSRAIDTVDLPVPASACIPNLVYGLLIAGTDQVTGTNSYGDKEKAQYFSYTGGGNITGVIVPFGMKKANSGTTNYTVKIYSATAAASGPLSLLATSQPIAYPAIDTMGSNTFNFTTSVPIPYNFFASVVVSPGTPGDDTVAVMCLYDGMDPTNVCGNGTAWEKQADNQWQVFNGTLPTMWGVDIELMLFPIIDNSTAGVNDIAPVTTHKLYPNPANQVVNLSYSLNATADVKFTLTDMSGKVMYRNTQAARPAGVYNEAIDITQGYLQLQHQGRNPYHFQQAHR